MPVAAVQVLPIPLRLREQHLGHQRVLDDLVDRPVCISLAVGQRVIGADGLRPVLLVAFAVGHADLADQVAGLVEPVLFGGDRVVPLEATVQLMTWITGQVHDELGRKLTMLVVDLLQAVSQAHAAPARTCQVLPNPDWT